MIISIVIMMKTGLGMMRDNRDKISWRKSKVQKQWGEWQGTRQQVDTYRILNDCWREWRLVQPLQSTIWWCAQMQHHFSV